MNKIKTIFIGTSNFAVPILKTLSVLEFIDLLAVVTQPDKPQGRKQILTPSPVKQAIRDWGLGINIEQPERIKRARKDLLKKYEPELIIVASYGQIIPGPILRFPKYGALNIHVSLLPHLRGAVPMQMAILEGLKKTGVTLQKMKFALDEGDIISIREIEIDENETTESLQLKSSIKASELLEEDLEKYIKGEIKLKKQDESLATYCSTQDIAKEKAEITEETSAEMAERMVRAFYPWPVAWMELKVGLGIGDQGLGKRLKFFKTSKPIEKLSDKFELIKRDNKLYLNLKDGALEIIELQLEGKKRDSASNYLYLV